MAQNLQMNPEKRDYVFENGSPIPSDRVLESAYFALAIPRGKYLYEQDNQGSLLHTLGNQKRTSSIEQQYSSYATQAIEDQVIKNDLATKVQVKNLEATRNGTLNEIDVTPSANQTSNQFNFVSV